MEATRGGVGGGVRRRISSGSTSCCGACAWIKSPPWLKTGDVSAVKGGVNTVELELFRGG